MAANWRYIKQYNLFSIFFIRFNSYEYFYPLYPCLDDQILRKSNSYQAIAVGKFQIVLFWILQRRYLLQFG